MEIRENLSNVLEKVTMAAQRVGRTSSEITLIAVSKTKPMEMIRQAAECGMTEFGENRPQELAEKYEQLPQVHWHQIGHLQKNKVRHIIDKTVLIHSVDSLELAQEIEKRARAADKVQDILIQVNISGEESKFGVAPQDTLDLCRQIAVLPHVHIVGLMTISVKGMSYEGNKQNFERLRQLSQDIAQAQIPGVWMRELSMGMTHDFEEAIEAGATMIRVGTGIFGARDYSDRGGARAAETN